MQTKLGDTIPPLPLNTMERERIKREIQKQEGDRGILLERKTQQLEQEMKDIGIK